MVDHEFVTKTDIKKEQDDQKNSRQIYTDCHWIKPLDKATAPFTNLDTGDLLTIVPVIQLPHFSVGALCVNPEVFARHCENVCDGPSQPSGTGTFTSGHLVAWGNSGGHFPI